MPVMPASAIDCRSVVPYTAIEKMKPRLGIENLIRMQKRLGILLAKWLLHTNGIGNSAHHLRLQGNNGREKNKR